MNPYVALKNQHQKEVNEFPLGFAFNEEQFNEMMAKWNLTPDDVDKIYRFGSVFGAFVRKSDSKALHEMLDRHVKERETAIKENKDDYLYHMFNYELANHEYSYTEDVTDTLDALDLTLEDIKADPRMDEALKRACKHQMEISW